MNESHDAALFQMGTLAVAQGKFDDAKFLYRRAVESKPGHVQVHLPLTIHTPMLAPAIYRSSAEYPRGQYLERSAGTNSASVLVSQQSSKISAQRPVAVVLLITTKQQQHTWKPDLARTCVLVSPVVRLCQHTYRLHSVPGLIADQTSAAQWQAPQHPPHVQALTNLGVLLKQDGRLAEAQALLQQALTAAPNDRTVLHSLAALYVLLGNAAGGGSAADTAADGLASGGARGGEAAGGGCHRPAPASPCLQPPADAPDTPASAVADAEGTASEASVQMRRAADDDDTPDDGVPVGADGDGEGSAAGDGDARAVSARAAYMRALAYDPTNADALYNLGVLDAAAEAWEAALFHYQTCVRLHPQHSMAWNNLGVVYQRVDNLPAAVECYEAAVATRPDFWLSLNNLGVIATVQGHAARAQRFLRAAIAANPEYAEAHNNMGVLLRDLGMVQEVRTHLPLPSPRLRASSSCSPALLLVLSFPCLLSSC